MAIQMFAPRTREPRSAAHHVVLRSLDYQPSPVQERLMGAITWLLVILVVVALIFQAWWLVMLLALGGAVYVAFVQSIGRRRSKS